ncbi:MAG TPA: FKBP-type peptidyl-prolyl cis-trans isomerase, partial [Vicinamibacterales bacterium]|nr:FKBP-type peptidyl-prolyl cis-trans isomerase [Vicinamibacterales bacterium]
KTLIALAASAVFVAGCGGAPEPAPEQQPTQAPTPAPEAKPPVETPAAPPPADTTIKTIPITPGAAPRAPKTPPAKPAYTRTDLKIGTGREAQKGKGISVNYTGWLYDPSRPNAQGRMFDSSKDRGPFNFVLGVGQVIPGWDQGFEGMKVGGRRRLIIPPSLAYGVDGAGGGIIPPNATLVFEMELLDVQE